MSFKKILILLVLAGGLLVDQAVAMDRKRKAYEEEREMFEKEDVLQRRDAIRAAREESQEEHEAKHSELFDVFPADENVLADGEVGPDVLKASEENFPFMDLPVDLKHMVFSFCDRRDLRKLRQVSKGLHLNVTGYFERVKFFDFHYPELMATRRDFEKLDGENRLYKRLGIEKSSYKNDSSQCYDGRYEMRTSDGRQIDLQKFDSGLEGEIDSMKISLRKGSIFPEESITDVEFSKLMSHIPQNITKFSIDCTEARGFSDEYFEQGLSLCHNLKDVRFYECHDLVSPQIEKESMELIWFVDCSKLKSSIIKVAKLDWLGFARCPELDENIALEIEELGKLEINFCNSQTIGRVLNSSQLPRKLSELLILLNKSSEKLDSDDLRKIFALFPDLSKIHLLNCKLNDRDWAFIERKKQENPYLVFDIKENYE